MQVLREHAYKITGKIRCRRVRYVRRVLIKITESCLRAESAAGVVVIEAALPRRNFEGGLVVVLNGNVNNMLSCLVGIVGTPARKAMCNLESLNRIYEQMLGRHVPH